MRHDDTGLIRLADQNKSKFYARIELMEADIVEYFKSRNEDSTMRTTAAPSRQQQMKSRVPSPQKQSFYSGFQSSRSQFRRDNRNQWPHTTDATYVGHYYPHSHLCTCDGRHHCTSHHSSHEHAYHESFCNASNSGYTYGHSSGGREHSSQHYGGPGSFY